MGISREKKSLGYTTQELKGEQLTRTSPDNLRNARKYLAVIDFDTDMDIETAEYSICNLHQLYFIQGTAILKSIALVFQEWKLIKVEEA